MNILFLTHRLPFPPNKGDKIRSFQILKHLAANHRVYVACVIDDPRDRGYVGRVEELAKGGVAWAPLHPKLDRILALPRLLTRDPITTSYFYSRLLQRKVDRLFERVEFNACVCFSSPMAEYLFKSRHAAMLERMPKIMDLIDVDSAKWLDYARRAPLWIRWVYRHEADSLARYEIRIAERFERVLLVSDDEVAAFPGAVKDKVGSMTNGVDLDFFKPCHTSARSKAGPTIVFTGAMDYWPNVEGIVWFAKAIWPQVRAKVGDARCFIVGSEPVRAVRELANVPGIIVTGYVDDVRDYVALADVCIAPLRVARGIQNKVLEAMAMAKPVVATRGAFVGVRAKEGSDLIVVDDGDEFAAAILRLIDDPQERKRLGMNARRCVETQHRWESALMELDRVLGSDRR